MSVEPLASPAMRPATAPVPPRPDGEDRWLLAAWSLHEFLPIALVPFGLVLFANYLVFGFLGWDSDAGAAVVTAATAQSAHPDRHRRPPHPGLPRAARLAPRRLAFARRLRRRRRGDRPLA